MFRLVASRAGEIVPFAAAALFWVDNEKSNFKVIGAVGDNARQFLNLKPDLSKGLAGKVLQSGKIEADEKLLLESEAISAETIGNLKSAIAVPLKEDVNRIFGVLTLYGDKEKSFDLNSRKLLEAVGERIAPLFISSLAFERSISNALTDSLTNLPNERAFYLILENQIAESQRQREERPLTVLTVDIKNFAGVNQRFGHATGDRILTFAADTIREQLRKMDFLARSTSDEFLIVLPTASEATTREIIERINKAFVINAFNIEQEKTHLKLNFGAATLGQDGETVKELLQAANIKRKQAKFGQNNKILWFPKEFVN
jgi:diguanylate cyclase (GGDEF)-like protein